MGLDMIKPFKILDTRTEADGSTGVIVEVWQVTAMADGKVKKNGMRCHMQIPQGQDVDAYLFDQFSQAGWF